MTLDLLALTRPATQQKPKARRSLDLEAQGFVRTLPIRWRLISLAVLNAGVAILLALVIWKGANVLDDSWDDVRRARESDKLLVQLEGEASRLQNLIHRYINQPSDSLLTEILCLHGEVLSTLRNRGAIDPVVSGSADELRTATERFLNGFEKVRTLQETITQSYENDVSTPAKDMAGLYGVIEDAIGSRDSALLHALAK